MNDINVDIQVTPNPNALKFITDNNVKNKGSSSYNSINQCGENKMAKNLLSLRGVDKLYFFENVITITKFSYIAWDQLEENIVTTIKQSMITHNPDYFDPDPEEERRKKLPKELLQIEEILDKHIRPALQADGGDILLINYQDNILLIRYQGACGTCPSATMGTLDAIKGVLRDEFNPDIDVFITPEEQL